MQELRLVAVSEDGTYLVLASAGRGTRFMLPVDDRLRAAVRGQFSRLGQYEIEVENPLRPKEIQARIRSGETAEAISELSGIPIERVRWFEGPVLQEREYMAQQAQRATVRRQGESNPGQRLGDIVTERIGTSQQENGDAVWDSWKLEDNTWRVRLTFLLKGESQVAHWNYDPRRRSVAPVDETAARFSSPLDEWSKGPGTDGTNVTPFQPRRQPARESPAQPEPQPGDSVTEREAPPRTAPPANTQVPAAPPPAVRPPAPAETPPAQRPAQRRTSIRQTGAATPPFPNDSSSSSSILTPPAKRKQQPPAVAEPPASAPEQPAAPAEQPAASTSTESTGTSAGNPGEQQKREQVPAASPRTPTTQPKRQRPKGRGRRASVPSWDEIMFGSRKPE